MAAGSPLKSLAGQDSLRGMDFETKEHFIRTKLKMLEFLGIGDRHAAPMKHLAPPKVKHHPIAPAKHFRPPGERVHVVPLAPRTPQVDAKRKHVGPPSPHKQLHHLGLATPKPPRKPDASAKLRRKPVRHSEEAIF